MLHTWQMYTLQNLNIWLVCSIWQILNILVSVQHLGGYSESDRGSTYGSPTLCSIWKIFSIWKLCNLLRMLSIWQMCTICHVHLQNLQQLELEERNIVAHRLLSFFLSIISQFLEKDFAIANHVPFVNALFLYCLCCVSLSVPEPWKLRVRHHTQTHCIGWYKRDQTVKGVRTRKSAEWVSLPYQERFCCGAFVKRFASDC